MVGECDGADACQHQVLGDLVGEGLDGHQENVGVANPGLRLKTPEADLAVVESDFVWQHQRLRRTIEAVNPPADTVSARVPASGAGQVPSAMLAGVARRGEVR